MKKYIVTVKHDNGRLRIKVGANSVEDATLLVCRAEGCPECAILSIKLI